MSSPNFERVKRDNPGLSDLLDRLIEYINRQKENGQLFFLPKLAAASLGLNDGEAFVLLELLANAEVLQRAFNVYCKANGELLATVRNESELNKIPHCDVCDTDHEPGDLKLELAFELNPDNDVWKAA